MHIEDGLFSSREKEVVDLLLQGKSNKQIALALGISVSTVEFHLKNVYSKLQVKSRTEAVLRLGESIGNVSAGNRWESIVDGTVANVENDGNTIPPRRFSMKQLFLIVGSGLLIIVIATASVFLWRARDGANIQPTQSVPLTAPATPTTLPGPATAETPTMASVQVSYLGTSFTIPSGLSNGSQNNIVPKSTDFMVWPAHTEFVLQGYPLANKVFAPQVLIYPANEFAQMNADSKATITNLKNILAAQEFSATEPLPFLPDEHALQVFHAREAFLTFQNGSGIRYITDYSQAAFPVLTDTIYTFQGLTRDGNYYVSVIMPVELSASANTPQPIESIPFDWKNVDAASYPNYVGTVMDALNHPDDSFNPPLPSLDALVQSLVAGGQK